MAGDVSAEEMQAAMRSVEDEGDAAAAAALEQETAEELAEFSADAGVAPSEAAEGEDEDAEGDDATRGRCGQSVTSKVHQLKKTRIGRID